MPIPKEHQDLLSKNDYKLKCNATIFNDEETELLNEFGHWLNGLASGAIKSITPEQRLFVLVANGNAEPETPFEKLWTRYLKRQSWEKDNKDIPHYEWVDSRDLFCPRNGYRGDEILPERNA